MVRHACSAMLLLATCSSASAQFVTPAGYGWSRGDAMTTHHQWDDFTTSVGPNAPDVASFPASVPGSSAIPAIEEVTGLASRTSTGNLYSFEHVLEFEVVVPTFDAAGGTTEVLLQTRTQGREIDQATIAANGLAPVEVVELTRVFLGPDTQFGGSLVDTLWRFEVPASTQVLIELDAEDTSMSLDQVSVDTRTTEDADCPADVNGDTVINDSDFFAWVTAFVADPRSPADETACDVNRDGSCSDSDFFAWVTAFIAGECG